MNRLDRQSVMRRLFAVAVLSLLASWACAQTCSVNSTGVNLGNYDYINGNSTTGTITLNCSLALLRNVTVALSAGTGSGASINNRFMSQLAPAGSDRLRYSMYQNAVTGPSCAGGIVWGDTPATQPAALGVLLIAPGIPHSWTVYACAPSAQDLSVASYGDTVTITISWL